MRVSGVEVYRKICTRRRLKSARGNTEQLENKLALHILHAIPRMGSHYAQRSSVLIAVCDGTQSVKWYWYWLNGWDKYQLWVQHDNSYNLPRAARHRCLRFMCSPSYQIINWSRYRYQYWKTNPLSTSEVFLHLAGLIVETNINSGCSMIIAIICQGLQGTAVWDLCAPPPAKPQLWQKLIGKV